MSPPAAPAETAIGSIRVRGARVHNLQNVDVDVPRGRFVVITGVSGSGKTSLAFDTLFAEGQRRYLETLSAHTRAYLDQMQPPDVDEIDGLPPTLSIEQHVGTAQPRSTLATTTEIHDFLRLLYARAGVPHCPSCGRELSQQSTQAIVEAILALETGRKAMILAPVVRGRKGTHHELFEKIGRDGFVRARVDGQIIDVGSPPELKKSKPHDIDVVVDRIVVKEGLRARLFESVELALRNGNGTCIVSHEEHGAWNDRLFSSRFACPDCGLNFPEVEPRTFSFNSPYGACPSCQGLGVVPPDSENECPDCHGARLGPVGRAVTFAGARLHELLSLSVADARRAVTGLLARLVPEAAASAPRTAATEQAGSTFDSAALRPPARLIAGRILPEVAQRLQFLEQVGLDYLTLDRGAPTLSGGEFQRARLAGCLGSGLIGVCYVLDEPTIGLHPRDTGRLLETLFELRDCGNSVLVVEHDLDVIRRADYLIDLGPGAGRDGGRVVACGTPREVARVEESATGRYLRQANSALPEGIDSDRLQIGARPVDPRHCLVLESARARNLQNLTVPFPLKALTCITGVSGSGKSTLVMETLVPLVRAALNARAAGKANAASAIAGGDGAAKLTGVEQIDRLVEIDQSPLGKNARSNPATASGIWDDIRRVFARTREARLRGFRAARFSFNVAGGRCEECRGQGVRRIAMQFLPEIEIVCPVCRGARFNRQTLEVKFRGKSVADILDMRIAEAVTFFDGFADLRMKLETFAAVGLGYLALGQSAATLSGGEAQRIKLATELSQTAAVRTATTRTLYVLDEPTTGLHRADIERLVHLLERLVDEGHTVIVIEHQLDVISRADHVIDLGPEGGPAGGRLVAQGPPAEIARVPGSHTGRALAGLFAARHSE